MSKQLRVYKNENDELVVKCPRCDEMISPTQNPLGLDGYDCPECDQVIESSSLRAYRKALKEEEDGLD